MASSQRMSAMFSQTIPRSKFSPYICRSCRQHLQQPPKSNGQQTRHAMGPYSRYFRKKIWGTENPPGLDDPYGPGFAERRQARLEDQAEAKRRQNLTVNERVAEDAAEEQVQTEPTYLDVGDSLPNEPFEDDPETVAEYKPAETWDGLEHIGHKGYWEDMAPKPGDHYDPWLPPKSELLWTRAELVSLLHQAVVESFAPSQIPNLDHEIIMSGDGALRGSERRGSGAPAEESIPAAAATEDALEEIEMTPDSTSVHDRDSSSASESELRNAVSDAEAERVIEEIAASSPNIQVAVEGLGPSCAVDEAFLSAKLNFAEPLAFEILKRFQQLSSLRLSDPFLNTLFTSNSQPPFLQILDHLLEEQKPKPQNLYEKLMEKPGLRQHANLMILPRRETPVDKEKEVGRWKIIERELRERGLPVLEDKLRDRKAQRRMRHA